ncbi:MAG: DinB family protein [Bacteroidota bacterium]
MYQLLEISDSLRQAFDQVTEYTRSLTDVALHQKPHPQKWSAAGNLEHLILSTKPLAKTLPLPKLTYKAFGKPNRPGRSYEELVKRYHDRLAEVAGTNPAGNSGFGPKTDKVLTQEELLSNWEKVTKKLVSSLSKWEDADLDKYLLPHPLLGKLTIREMMFFTHYHTLHHLAIMRERAGVA